MKKPYGFLALILLVGLQTACGATSSSDQDVIISHLATQQSAQATQLAGQDELIQYLLTIVPRNTPRDLNVTVEPTPYTPVTGSVVFEDGSCCAGGIVGDTIELHIQFEAMSPIAEVTQMRYMTGSSIADEQDILSLEWQNYQSEVVIDYQVNAVNWLGHWVTVQYMDADGNVSPLISDDISIEGMPEMPTLTP